MRGLKDSKGTSPLADRQIPVGYTRPPEPCASYESGPRLSLGPLRWLLRVLLAEVRWESFGVVWVEEAVAAADPLRIDWACSRSIFTARSRPKVSMPLRRWVTVDPPFSGQFSPVAETRSISTERSSAETERSWACRRSVRVGSSEGSSSPNSPRSPIRQVCRTIRGTSRSHPTLRCPAGAPHVRSRGARAALRERR